MTAGQTSCSLLLLGMTTFTLGIRERFGGKWAPQYRVEA